MDDSFLRPPGAGRRPERIETNRRDLVVSVVSGQIAHPVGRPSAYRIGHDGVPRVLPGTGGITLNLRIGDRCVGLQGDHIEPGVSLHNNGREVIGPRNGPNMALMTYACVGNRARVVSGPCTGQPGLVTGKHGGVNHVMVDFPTSVLRRLRIGDRVQIVSAGLGLALPRYPELTLSNCAPDLLERWGVRPDAAGGLSVPVTHIVPGRVMGSGLGKDTVWRGDFDLQLFDDATRQRHRLGTLRFGDFVAVAQRDARFGPAHSSRRMVCGVVVHGDSVVSGHGPGVTALISGPAHLLRPRLDANANLAFAYGRRLLPPQRDHRPLAAADPGSALARRRAEPELWR